MKVKGTGIKTTKEFVKQNFPDRFEEWVDSLHPDIRNAYSGRINLGDWFDADIAYFDPAQKMTDMFFDGDPIAAGEALGRFSAHLALNSIYKVFLILATPKYLMQRSANMMKAYYDHSVIQVELAPKGGAKFMFNEFDGINEVMEYRAAGWCSCALELCHCRNVKWRMDQQLTKGDNATVISFTWE